MGVGGVALPGGLFPTRLEDWSAALVDSGLLLLAIPTHRALLRELDADS